MHHTLQEMKEYFKQPEIDMWVTAAVAAGKDTIDAGYEIDLIAA